MIVAVIVATTAAVIVEATVAVVDVGAVAAADAVVDARKVVVQADAIFRRPNTLHRKVILAATSRVVMTIEAASAVSNHAVRSLVGTTIAAATASAVRARPLRATQKKQFFSRANR
jgi:hypothetical protein